ncbi:MAG: DUF2723 domain-containing protein, partial [Verrucomicrobiales bacterium]|nr:DUF2723 domain-containing protein [Verrucomicrobiales bacterium]
MGGCVAGLMLGFSGFMWSQAVIVEVYTLSVLSLMGVLCCLYRWTQDTARMRYLYWTFFWFGICLCNHQTLIVAAMGIETVILFAHPRLGRNFFTVNALVYLAVLVAMATGSTELFSGNAPMQVIFHMLGVSFIGVAGSLWLVTLAQDSGRGGFNPARELRESLKIIWSSLAYGIKKMCVLRDPVDRWISGFAECFCFMDVQNIHELLNLDSFWDTLLKNPVYDDHTEYQHRFVSVATNVKYIY